MTSRWHKLVAMAALAGILAATPAAAQTLRWVEGTDADTLDPQIQRSRPAQILTDHIFDPLVRWKDTKLSDIVPALALSWERSEGDLLWTFKLRQGVLFHDGTPFDAAAAKFSLERAMDPKTGSPNRSLFGPIDRIEAPDAHTLRIHTKTPMPTMLEVLAGSQAMMLSPTAVQKNGRDSFRLPVGTGPFIFEEWIPNEHIKLRRNDQYWGVKPLVQKFHFRPVPEAGARVVELESGNADIVTNIPPEAADRLKRNPRVKIEVVPSSFQIFFELNLTKPPFNDVRVRKAINHAVDRKAIVEKILGGYGAVPDGLFPEGVQGRIPLEPYAYDPELAKRLVKEAFPGGFDGKVVLWTPNGRYAKDRQVSEAVQGWLNGIGLQTEFRSWEWASYQRELYRADPGGTGKGTNNANMWMLGTSIPDADWRLRRKVVSGDPSNLTGYSNPKVDALMKSASTNMNYEARMKDYQEVQRIFWSEDAAWLILFNQVQIIGLNPKVEGLEMFAYEVPILNRVTFKK